MCYVRPGPRCSTHARERLAKAIEKAKVDPTNENFRNLAEMKKEFDGTLDGQKHLAELIAKLEEDGAAIGNSVKIKNLKQRSIDGKNLRESQMQALKEANERRDASIELVKEQAGIKTKSSEGKAGVKVMQPAQAGIGLKLANEREIERARSIARNETRQLEALRKERSKTFAERAEERQKYEERKSLEEKEKAAQRAMDLSFRIKRDQEKKEEALSQALKDKAEKEEKRARLNIFKRFSPKRQATFAIGFAAPTATAIFLTGFSLPALGAGIVSLGAATVTDRINRRNETRTVKGNVISVVKSTPKEIEKPAEPVTPTVKALMSQIDINTSVRKALEEKSANGKNLNGQIAYLRQLEKDGHLDASEQAQLDIAVNSGLMKALHNYVNVMDEDSGLTVSEKKAVSDETISQIETVTHILDDIRKSHVKRRLDAVSTQSRYLESIRPKPSSLDIIDKP